MEAGATYSVSGEDYIVTFGNNECLINKKGEISSIKANGVEKLSSPIRPNFFRATIDNDALPQVPAIISDIIMGVNAMRKAQKTLKVKEKHISEVNGVVKVEIDWNMRYMKKLHTIYQFGGNGVIEFSMDLIANHDLERYGFTWKLAENIDGIEMYAKGPHENYCDRSTSAKLGVWKGKAEDFIHDYLYPQDNGNHTGVRYAIIGGDNRVSLRAVDKPFEMTIHPYDVETLYNAKHMHELEREKALTICVDGKQRGVGGDVPAMANTKPQYKILPKEKHTLKFTLKV